MAKSETQINRFIKPILRKVHGELTKIHANYVGGSPAEPATFDTSEPIEKGSEEIYTSKYGKDILAADNYEEFSKLIVEIASLEGLNVSSDLDEVAKIANLIRQKHGLEAL